jgi:8-oxo-dGTP diphosphatase
MSIRAAAILIENRQICLIERLRAEKHYFTFPGGGVEEGETPEQAVVREIMEELGLQIKIERLVAEVWFRGSQQLHFLVKRIGGTFGTGTGEEYTPPLPDDPHVSTYLPIWMDFADLAEKPVLPREMAKLVLDAQKKGWPEIPVVLHAQDLG